jgi:hypothetical protein
MVFLSLVMRDRTKERSDLCNLVQISNLMWRCQRGGLSFLSSFASKNIRYRFVCLFTTYQKKVICAISFSNKRSVFVFIFCGYKRVPCALNSIFIAFFITFEWINWIDKIDFCINR